MRTQRRLIALATASAAMIVTAVAVGTATGADASAPPVGPLPPGPRATLVTEKGQLVAVALPHRSKGRVWRIARPVNAVVLRQISEADVGSSVVLVFRAAGAGTARLAFGLTRGERPKAYESRAYTVIVH